MYTISNFVRTWGAVARVRLPLVQPMRLGPFYNFSLNKTHALSVSSSDEVLAFMKAQIDWNETPEAHIFKASLPGVKKEGAKVKVKDGRVLKISGECKMKKEENNDRWHSVEKISSSFSRKFRLPENANVEEVKASLENRVLTVTVPKVP